MNITDERAFRKLLWRNVALPLATSAVVAVVFLGLIFHLINVTQWVDHTDRTIASINQILKLIIDSETGLRGYFMSGETLFLEPYDRAKPMIEPTLAELRKSVSDNPAQVTRVGNVTAKYLDWSRYAEAAWKLKKAGGDPEKALVSSHRAKGMMDGIRVEFDDMLNMEERLRMERSGRSTENVRYVALIFILLSIVSGAIIAVMGRRQLLSLSASYEDSLQTQEKQNIVLQNEAWVKSGQNALNDRLKGELTVSQITSAALDYLCDYLGAVRGVVYLRENKNLVRSAAWGYTKSTENPADEIEIGEGLLGQAVREGRVVSLSPVPPDFKFFSATGSGAPTSLIIQPITNGQEILGAIELALLKVDENTAHLMTLAGISLAIAVKSSQYRLQLEELLHESQQQSEELQVQQEELRQTNENLNSQAEELRVQQLGLEKSNRELEAQQAALEEKSEKLTASNTELERTQAEVQKNAEALLVASKYKSEFLANMSHELRTPLNSVLILAKLLKDNSDGNLTEDEVESAATIHSSASDLLVLINDILDIAKVEAGKVELEIAPAELSRIADNMKRVFRPQCQAKNLDFEVAVSPNCPREITTDRGRLEQVLKNLISNAIKFTKKGHVRILFTEPSPHLKFNNERLYNVSKIAIEVEDTGIGIPSDKRDLVFEAFKQVDSSTSRLYGGTGLGLTIARELSALLGGEIKLNSEVTKGSTFTVIIPERYVAPEQTGAVDVTPREPAPIRTPAPLPPQSERVFLPDDRNAIEPGDKVILIVEDDLGFNSVLMNTCHKRGFKCLVAADGEDGLQDAIRYKPQGILLDNNLPKMSGLNVLERVKSDPRIRHIPIHMISVEDRATEALERGAVGYLQKPVTKEDIDSALKKVEDRMASRTGRVLIVEDNQAERLAIEKLVGTETTTFVEAETGEEAMELLRTERFDVMILDLKLAEGSGFQLLEKMESIDAAGRPPVIVYTGKDLSREERERLSSVAGSIIIKGVRSPERLLQEVTLFLHKVDSELPAEKRQILEQLRHREDAFDGKKVLVVDDDMRNVFSLRTLLKKRGIEVVVARTGAEAILCVEKNPDIDIVLMDIMMPEMDGFEATRRIRGDRRFKELPIIALTAKVMKGDRERCLESGASDYLAKPIDTDNLLSLMRVWLST